MAKTLKEALGEAVGSKVRIGFTDMKGYQAALDALKQPYKTIVVNGGKNTIGSSSTNEVLNVDLSGSVQDGFITDTTLKQMWLKLGVFGGVPVEKNGEACIAAPPNTTGDATWTGGQLNAKFNICPATAVA